MTTLYPHVHLPTVPCAWCQGVDQFREEILQAVARGWCHEVNKNKEIDADLANAITEELLPVLLKASSPNSFIEN